MGNGTELTIAKAATGVAATNKLEGWKSTAKVAELTQTTTMGVTGALGKHPSTVTYGFTVTKLSADDLVAATKEWQLLIKTAAKKPYVVYAIRSQPSIVLIAEKALTITSSKWEKESYIAFITVAAVMSHKGEEDVEA